MTVARPLFENSNHGPKRAKVELQLALSFSEKDKFGTIQPHDDALMVTLRIGGFDGKMVILMGQVKLPVQTGSEVVKQLKEPGLSGDLSVEAECEALERVTIGDDKEKYFQIGAQLPPQEKEKLVKFLKGNLDVFAWNAYKAPRVGPSFICHHLNVNLAVVPRKQPPRRSSKEHSKAIKEEVIKLKKARAIKEVFYPNWLANTVVVKKKNGKWRVCVDFTDLNKACPKDLFPMPRIDQLVDTTIGHPQRSFLDTFQGYYQIPLALEDQEKTAFVTLTGSYHYKLKEYLPRPPIMSRPKVDEVPFAYIVVVSHVVSLVLIRVDNGVQRPVYYVLADLVAKFAEPSLEKHTKRSDIDEKSVGMISQKESLSWKVYVDGAANQRGSGVGLVIISPDKIVIKKFLIMGFSATNNEAEYETLLIGMNMVQKMGGKNVEMFSDSRLVVGQVEGELEAKDSRMQEYLNQVRRLQSNFESITLVQISRNRNTHADPLATLETSSAQILPRVILVEDLCTLTKINVNVVRVHQIKLGPNWMVPVVLYLKENILPEEKSEADKIRRKAHRFWLSEDQKLYKHSFSGPYLLCMHPEATEPLLEELHEGICGSHTGGRSLVA
ncbi:uncharacterized protein LOC142625922 [Castanea sativa]|uniref:uncharacterized protein LOC142625922 n=1 Tax=Castanea sativa TaxID=21020 RepID=UPI003F650088